MQKRAMPMGLGTPPSHILTEEEIARLKEEAVSIGVPLEKLIFNQGARTGFRDRNAMIYIRGDVLPDTESLIARDRMSSRAVWRMSITDIAKITRPSMSRATGAMSSAQAMTPLSVLQI